MDTATVPLSVAAIRPADAARTALHSTESIIVVCGLIAVVTTIAFSLLAAIGAGTL
ncbi:hypothetical protein [Glaciihabitans sp. INWT7]|uniref:hypothetical protein n=1 Tax=Glaciihabitans sp. INWT7 TaxID=2596912 RepID=UPI001625CE64|nr:hypothetical protein [Glaciihabitans sp. INWT7]